MPYYSEGVVVVVVAVLLVESWFGRKSTTERWPSVTYLQTLCGCKLYTILRGSPPPTRVSHDTWHVLRTHCVLQEPPSLLPFNTYIFMKTGELENGFYSTTPPNKSFFSLPPQLGHLFSFIIMMMIMMISFLLPYLLPFRPTSNNTEQSRESPSAVSSSLYFCGTLPRFGPLPLFMLGDWTALQLGWPHPLEIGLKRKIRSAAAREATRVD